MMKVSIREGGLAEWFLCHVGGSDDEKLDKLVKQPGWSAESIEFSISLNGIEFTELDDLFVRLTDHIKAKAEEMAGQDALINAKIEAMYKVMNAESVEELGCV